MLPCGESEVGSIFTKNEMTGREKNKNILRKKERKK